MALNHTHQKYDNFVLATEFENQYQSKLDLMRFCTVDDSLVGTPGTKKKINRYSATNGTEVLTMGNGNTKNIEVKLTQEEYEIEIPFEINGFEYQIREVSNCIRAGRTHSGIYTPQMSLQTLSLIDDIRAGWNMKFPFER